MYEKAGSWTISYSHLASRLYYHNCLNFLPELVITCSWLYRTKWLNRGKIIGRMSWKANWRQIFCSAPLQHPKPTFARLDIQIPALPCPTYFEHRDHGSRHRRWCEDCPNQSSGRPGDRGDWLLVGDWQQCGRPSNTSRWCFMVFLYAVSIPETTFSDSNTDNTRFLDSHVWHAACRACISRLPCLQVVQSIKVLEN